MRSNKWVKAFAFEIDTMATLPVHAGRFGGMINDWWGHRLRKHDEHIEWLQKLTDHYKRFLKDERLQDENAGPPEKGWQFLRYDVEGDCIDVGSWDEDDGDIGAWTPSELWPENEPDTSLPLPLANRLYSLAEKYVLLAAIHDTYCRRSPRLGPVHVDRFADRRDPIHRLTQDYSKLVQQVRLGRLGGGELDFRQIKEAVEADLAKAGQLPGGRALGRPRMYTEARDAEIYRQWNEGRQSKRFRTYEEAVDELKLDAVSMEAGDLKALINREAKRRAARKDADRC